MKLRPLAVKIRNVTFLENVFTDKLKLLNDILSTIYQAGEALYILIHINGFSE
jgi:hypothetical protein